MDFQSIKIELAKLILSIDNPEIVDKIKKLLTKEKVGADSITAAEREEIELAIQMLNAGDRISFEDFLQKVS